VDAANRSYRFFFEKMKPEMVKEEEEKEENEDRGTYEKGTFLNKLVPPFA
jgi:hypothetical protein